MSLSNKVAEKVRTVIIATLNEKRADGKISRKKFQSLLEGVEDSSDRSILEMTVLSEDKKKKKFWIQKAIKHPGALHKELGVAKGKKIPAKKLAIKPGDSAKVKKQKVLAKNLKKMNKKG